MFVGGEVWALLHSCKKPISSKELVSKEEIVQRKDGKMFVDGEVWELSNSCEKFYPKDKIVLSQMKWENILRHRNVNREDGVVYWEEMAPNVDGFASTKKTLSHERKRKM
eukprot:12695889-Ditylum_brightwellii.AAC.1